MKDHNELAIVLEVHESTLTITLLNQTEENFSFECYDIERDLLIACDDASAQYMIQGAIYSESTIVSLKKGESDVSSFNIYDWFLFPKPGLYKVSMCFKPRRIIDGNAKEMTNTLFSNTTFIKVEKGNIKPNVCPPLDKEKYLRALSSESTRKWWMFWKW